MEAAYWTEKVVVGNRSWTDAPNSADMFLAGWMTLCQTVIDFVRP